MFRFVPQNDHWGVFFHALRRKYAPPCEGGIIIAIFFVFFDTTGADVEEEESRPPEE